MISFKSFIFNVLIITTFFQVSIFAFQEEGQFPIEFLQDKPVPGDSPVFVCDASEPQILTIDLVDLSPNPPQRGAKLTISAIGHLSKEVEEGAYVSVEVKYGYIKLISQTYDLCEQVQEVDLKCPLKAGKYKLSKDVEIPNEVPPGKYVVYARAYTKDDEFIACITATVLFTVDSWKIIS